MTKLICSVPRCGRASHGWSYLCGRHSAQQYMHGATGKAGIRESDYRPYRDYVAAGILKYGQTAATAAALKLADQILQYRGTEFNRPSRQLERVISTLRDDAVTPADILHRVCLHVAYASVHLARFSGGPKVERIAIARAIMRLAPLPRAGQRHPSKALRMLGDLVFDDGLYLYGIRLIDRLKADDETQRALKDAVLQLDTPAVVAVPTEQRAGVIHRKRRGVQ
jgi:hypothetical protein